MPNVARNVRSGDRDVDGLLETYRWSTSALTFSFPTSASQYSDGYRFGEEPYDNFQALSARQQAAVVDILGDISSVATLAFSQRSGGAGDLRFGMSDLPETAHAYTPTSYSWGGDSWYNNSGGDYDDPVRGNYAYTTFIHEIGHALGLKHPHEAENFGAVSRDHDWMAYTVMTYRSYQGAMVGSTGGFTNETWGYAQSPMMYDIAALQHMYGANYGTNADDSVYRWNPATGEMSVNGSGQGEPGANRVFQTVWDGGGNDGYDLSLYSGRVVIDLRPGHWTTTSSVQLANLGEGYVAPGNIANALLHDGDRRSLIENAIGGGGNDRLTGNEAGNRLDGGAGADTMTGGAGNDIYVVDDAGDAIVEADNAGLDTVLASIDFTLARNIETLILTGSRAIDGTGSDLSDRITGNRAANALRGRDGDDILDGAAGADTMNGGA